MSKPPPDDLMQWSKPALAKEVARLRAITREHAISVPGDPRAAPAPDAVTDVAKDPYAAGGAILDARNAVLLDAMEVVLVDTKADDPVAMMMALKGRINYSRDRVEHAYLFGPDGAAALLTEIMGLTDRAAAGHLPHGRRFSNEFNRELNRRMREMP